MARNATIWLARSTQRFASIVSIKVFFVSIPPMFDKEDHATAGYFFLLLDRFTFLHKYFDVFVEDLSNDEHSIHNRPSICNMDE